MIKSVFAKTIITENSLIICLNRFKTSGGDTTEYSYLQTRSKNSGEWYVYRPYKHPIYKDCFERNTIISSKNSIVFP